MSIRITSQALSQRLSSGRVASLSSTRGIRLFGKTKSRKRAVRYGLLSLNAVVLITVVWFVVQNPNNGKAASTQKSLISSSSDNIASNPLDQLSSADIAAHVAIMTHLPEANAVANHADSVNDQLTIAPVDNKVIAKPQIINTTAKTRKDILKYVVQSGDSVPTLAAKFSVSSESIRWSNGLTGDALAVNKQLWIPPINNGIVYEVKKGDTPDALASTYHTNKDAIISFNDAEVGGLPVGQRIVIPDGSLPPPRASVSFAGYGGFAWGGYSAVYSGSNAYDYGWCTWYASVRRAQIGRPVPSNLGNAYSWYRLAQRSGLPTGLSPAVGAVAVSEGGDHVSVVEAVNPDGSFWVSEMNSRGQVSMTNPAPAGGWARVDYKMYHSAGSLKFVY